MKAVLTSEHQSVSFEAGKLAGGFTMSLAEVKAIEFFPPGGPAAAAAKLGFRFGDTAISGSADGQDCGIAG